MVSDANSIEYHEYNTTYFGDGNFIMSANANLELQYYYYIHKANYWSMEEEKQKYISVTDHNDHYFEAEESFETSIDFNLALHIEIPQTENILKNKEWLNKAFENAIYWIESIDQIEIVDQNIP